uniref:Sodium/calcium exchanger membrane region domain-containing protein n=1 Tax=Pyrodinium bahamense TaxID=73915 RepID=A0A7R9ZZ75_9DINO|mmetsp:Transcript_15459/g.42643  ORF Transcript_15459/g.42643 Transcript_15459/m.42643 type:complete len:737 (+) Transcript_15459:157-2367(+)
MVSEDTDFAICKPGGRVSLLPLFGDNEQRWPEWLRSILYAMGLIYFFLGVAIIADAFVAAIEVVTSRRRQKRQKSGRLVTEKVWNDTVSTLSLMALGSSAPEIALAIVDLFKKRFHFTPLGAQTIAGSAAFNLLVIVAVCIFVIPSTETRQIAELPAFYVTAVVSVFAYLWLAFILITNTEDVVDIWEAIATLLFLPMLIWIAYKVDVGDAAKFLARLNPAWGRTSEVEEEDEGKAVLAFDSESVSVQAGGEATEFEVVVKRPAGAAGSFSCTYRTELFGAVPGFDYTEADGRLEFAEDVATQSIKLEILPKVPDRVDRKFLLILEDAAGNVEFSDETDGGKDAAFLTVTITSPSAPGTGCRCLRWMDALVNFNGVRRGTQDWIGQITDSVYCLGSPEEQKEATKWDWAGHIVALPWKLIFSFVPPTTFFGGWACFYAALLTIAGLTIFISDLAELFGCVVGIRDDVTAIVFVALGTSMPDLFASLTAAKEDDTADASIVNVTGSNSVNVFLGLGLPWTMGALYWAFKGQTDEWRQKYPEQFELRGEDGGAAFIVQSKNLGFCVIIFSCACVVALFLLHLRRRLLGAELGGPFVPKAVTTLAFLLFWFGFISVTSWRVMHWEESTWLEVGLVIGGLSLFESLVAIFAIVVICVYRERGARSSEREAVQGTVSRSTSGQSFGAQSIGSNSSKPTEMPRAPTGSSLGEGILDVARRNGIGLHVLRPCVAAQLFGTARI